MSYVFDCILRSRWIAIAFGAALIAAALIVSHGRGAVHEPVSGAQVAERAKALEHYLRHRPGDGRAWVILARSHFGEKRYRDAAQAYERAVAADVRIARDPQVWCELADTIALTQGTLQGKPPALIEKALALNANHRRALEMAGGAALEARDYRAALGYWEQLLAQLPEDGAERGELERALRRVAMLAGEFPQR